MKHIFGALQSRSTSNRSKTLNLETGKAFEMHLNIQCVRYFDIDGLYGLYHGLYLWYWYNIESFNDRFDGVVLAYGDGQLTNDSTDHNAFCICKHLGNDFQFRIRDWEPQNFKIQINMKDTLKTSAYVGVVVTGIIPIFILFVKIFRNRKWFKYWFNTYDS